MKMTFIAIWECTTFYFSRRQNSNKTLALPIFNYFLLTFAKEKWNKDETQTGKFLFLLQIKQKGQFKLFKFHYSNSHASKNCHVRKKTSMAKLNDVDIIWKKIFFLFERALETQDVVLVSMCVLNIISRCYSNQIYRLTLFWTICCNMKNASFIWLEVFFFLILVRMTDIFYFLILSLFFFLFEITSETQYVV